MRGMIHSQRMLLAQQWCCSAIDDTVFYTIHKQFTTMQDECTNVCRLYTVSSDFPKRNMRLRNHLWLRQLFSRICKVLVNQNHTLQNTHHAMYPSRGGRLHEL